MVPLLLVRLLWLRAERDVFSINLIPPSYCVSFFLDHLMYRKYICLTNLFPPQRAVFVFSICCFYLFISIIFFCFLSLTVLMETGYGREEKDYCWYLAATYIILS